MPIHDLDLQNDTVLVVCTECKNERTFGLADLQLGVSYTNGDKSIEFPDSVMLPQCPGCGAHEQWRRADLPHVRYGAVNLVCKLLREKGFVDPNIDYSKDVDPQGTPDTENVEDMKVLQSVLKNRRERVDDLKKE